MSKTLQQLYRDPALPGSFGGINTLQRVLKGKLKTKAIKNWLQKKDSYTLHKPLRHKFSRNRVIVGGLNEQFQADLVDMQSLAKFNDDFRYLLTCTDVLSKYSFVIPLKDKKSSTIVKAFEKIFSERLPMRLQCDSGTEFKNRQFQDFLKEKGVHFFTTYNSTKASVVERFNRTLKTKMWKYFTEMNTKRYIDVIDKLVQSYNRTWHRSIKMKPEAVTTENQIQVWNTLYGNDKNATAKPLLKVGDTVRISREKLRFEKGYEQNWTREIFTISKIIKRNPIVYKLRDLVGDSIEGTFYEEELQKITDSGYYPVEKVLKTRKTKGKTQYFVKFQGYPEKFNAWVHDIKRI